MANSVQVIEKNEGPKIAWSQKDSKLIFGDDDLAIRCDTRQRDYPVHVDICADDDGNLITGVGRYYIAQIDIPAAKYEEREAEQLSMAEMDGDAYADAVERERLPLDMADVVLTLWDVSGYVPVNQNL